MDNEKLIEDLRGLLKQYGEKIPYGELVGAPWPYSRSGDLVWQDPEPYFIEQASTALSTLQAENEKLRVEAEGMRSNWYKSVEEIQKLRAELEQVKREGKIPKYTIGDTVYDRFGNAWEVTAVELHSMRTKNEWLYRCGHKGTDDYRALWHFEAFPSKEDALRMEQE